jgi:hypothetical protein
MTFDSYAPRRPDFFEVECGLPPRIGAGRNGLTFGNEASAAGAPGRLVEKSGMEGCPFFFICGFLS